MGTSQQHQHEAPAFINGSYTQSVHDILINGGNDDFEKLRGVPGVVLEKMPWHVAKALVEEHTEASLGKLGRHPLDTRQYWHFRQQVRALLASGYSPGVRTRNCKSGHRWSTMFDTVSMASQPSATAVCLWIKHMFAYAHPCTQ